ncbi:MAG: adenosine deaminase [Lachnospiraceae bacterium]|nr:adenosine deaminase [Lachnospiraceae bacterium]
MEHNDFKNKILLDLHCHLDGSFSPEFIKKATGDSRDLTILNKLLSAPDNCSSLTEYLTCFDLPIKALQTKENITSGVLDVLSKAHNDGMKYIELRFAPSCSMEEGLSLPEIYEAAITGSKLGFEKYGIYSNIILCAMRHHDTSTNMKILDTMYDYVGHGICALDLAGDESMFPNQDFTDLFKKAKAMNIPFTIHSGECGSVENVRLAMEFGARRIGHGIALIKDASLMEDIKNMRIGLELCPVSNFQTKAWTDYATYPLRNFLDKGLLATINTDNRTVSQTSMARELSLASSKLNITKRDYLTMNKNSVEVSFADDNLKHKLLNIIESNSI